MPLSVNEYGCQVRGMLASQGRGYNLALPPPSINPRIRNIQAQPPEHTFFSEHTTSSK